MHFALEGCEAALPHQRRMPFRSREHGHPTNRDIRAYRPGRCAVITEAGILFARGALKGKVDSTCIFVHCCPTTATHESAAVRYASAAWVFSAEARASSSLAL